MQAANWKCLTLLNAMSATFIECSLFNVSRRYENSPALLSFTICQIFRENSNVVYISSF